MREHAWCADPCVLGSAGFAIYLLSKWDSGRKQASYPVHRFLGSASLLSGFLSILLGLMEDQVFSMYSAGGLKTFFTASKAHAFGYAIIAGLGLVLFLLAISVMFTFVVFTEQAAPALAAGAKEGELAYRNGIA